MSGKNNGSEKVLHPEEIIKLLLAQQAAESYLAVRNEDGKVSFVGRPMVLGAFDKFRREQFEETTQAGRCAGEILMLPMTLQSRKKGESTL